ncbi:alkylmercury lyase [Arthrobacter sp. MYb211]|uniref:organomercurial lyase MerB n=1 Tax=Micrococcaceae TaxID=1268 RepID=UPI000CFCB5EC|nr:MULTISPECIES: organomercurial lyase MerB [unclassified Arthrobacter]PRA12015.1 alkylmercury lyase [Arthrobacter sp. MYb221]PRC08369.1 alkylmercury lyase [Arthrobacter sp. MYb211]
MTNNVSQITGRLASSETGMQSWLWLPLLKLLALGDPVDAADLAAATGRPVEDVRTALEGMPDVEYDGSGRIVGMGLTQRPTRHRFEVDGEQLYTWCALDTLIFPTLLGTSARIESAYDAASTPVRMRAGSSGVTGVEPATAVVSLINPEDISSVRSAFCNQVHFFASAEEAGPWLKDHPEGTVIPVEEAYGLAASMAGKMLAETDAQDSGKPRNTALSCTC